MIPADLCLFISLLLTHKETIFLPPFLLAGWPAMVCKPSSMEDHKPHHNLKHDQTPQPQPHLSGAYIRTLVKHLTNSNSIKSKHPSNEDHNNNMHQQTPSPQRKQVRRRRHTTKPYQERLLNMAEARREIVTALKFHRASMKQREATGDHRQPEQYLSTTTTTTTTNAVTATDLSGGYLQHYWPVSTTSPPPLPPPVDQENLDFKLPVQTLGLNLNFQDFENLDSFNLYHNPLSNFPTSSLSSSSSSSSASSSSSSSSSLSPSATTASSWRGGLHHAVDDEGMEEIRSLGEQHQMEWNDTVNLLTSARWFKFLKAIEVEQEDGKFDDEVDPLDHVEGIPLCMDIGEIDGMNVEWLA